VRYIIGRSRCRTAAGQLSGGTAVATALIVSACWSGPPSEAEADFVGEVVSADTDSWRTSSGESGAASSGGINSQMKVGPATFHLADGTTLDVPPNTPGGNMCSLLGTSVQPGTATCLVAGALDESGAVAWFAIQPLVKLGDGSFQLTVDRFEGRDAIVLVGGTWVPVPVRFDAKLRCAEPGDLAATPVEVPSRARLATLNAEGEVVAVECLYHG
jgi:hypothetical protein